MKKYLLMPALFIAYSSFLIAFWGCSGNNNKSDAYGTFESTEITVSAEGNGRLLTFNVEEGQVLKKNSVVGIIDTTDLVLKKLQLIAQRAALMDTRQNIISQINVQKQQKANLMVDKKRIYKLFADSAATKKQKDDIDGSIRLVNKQIASIQTQNLALTNNIKALTMQIAQVQNSIKDCYVTNPVNGTVLTKYAELGEYATIGKPLYNIADLSIMYLRAYVSGLQLPNIKVGQKATVLIDKNKQSMRKLEGTVSWVSQTAEFTPKIVQTKQERVNLVYAVKILVPNDGSLKIGMPGEVDFQ